MVKPVKFKGTKSAAEIADRKLATLKRVVTAEKMERNFDKTPYSPDEQRVAEYIVELTGVGAGDDPIGFLIASHRELVWMRKGLEK